MSESALDAQDALVFYGNDGVEAEEFVRSVMRIAKAAGRFRDNDWIIEEAATALAGDALRWYIELDDEIQNDWKLLRRAILQRYPSPSRRTPPETNITSQVVSGGLPIAPTAAAAAPPVASVSLSQEPRNIFRIKILPILGGIASFIGMKDGNVIKALSSSEALTVKHCQQTQELRGYGTGEKLAVRGNSSGGMAMFGNLGLVDYRGHSRSESPVSSTISITAWNVGANNRLKATYLSPVEFYLVDDGEQQYQAVRLCVNPDIPFRATAQFLNLQLEEV